ncbi:MAG: hypothetical protein OXC07_04155, partial [Kistimonas sp.]|nr:hypothetical protein [Kistimonas sp.]
PGLNLLCPSPPSPIAQLGWEQSPSATEGMVPDWSPWLAQEYPGEDWLPLFSTSASDLEVPPLLLTDDDKAFWQALVSPAHGEQ